MPRAGSFEIPWPDMVGGRYKTRFRERVGWVSWTGTGHWLAEDPQAGAMDNARAYGPKAFESITNGVLWSRVGKDLSVYVCDAHKALWKSSTREETLRSYVMNGYFGYQIKADGSELVADRAIKMDNLAAGGNAGNLLLFAELPPLKDNGGNDEQTTIDSVLENKRGYSKGKEEILGFYHKVGKRNVAHVAFADGHVDVLIEPQGAAIADLKRLTEQLCNGEEIESDLRKKMR